MIKMPIDASIYSQLKPVEMPSYMDSQAKAANLSQLAMQQAHGMKQMQQEDKDAQFKDQQRKVSVFGSVLSSMDGKSPEQRAAMWPQARAQLLESGVGTPEAIPEQLPNDLVDGYLRRFKQSPEYMDMQLKQAQTNKYNAEASKDRALAAKGPADKSMEISGGLRKEWTGLPTTKTTQDVAQSIERIRNAYDNPSPAGDMSLIYSFMRLNDPSSTVKESEFASAKNAAAIPEVVRAHWIKIKSGETLTPEQRHDFALQAERMYGGQLTAQKTVDDQYTFLAQKYGVDPELVKTRFPNPREMKLAIKKEEEKPGWLASLFGVKGAVAATPKAPPKVDYKSMSDDEIFKQWLELQEKK